MVTATDTRTRERDLTSLSLVTTVVVLVIVTMTFGALITVFFIRAEQQQFWTHMKIPVTLWFTTTILLTSSATLERARLHLFAGDQTGFFRLTAWATGLGLLFLIGQLAVWFQVLDAGVMLANNPHAWFIFLFSGLHGLHILAGVVGLIYLLIRTHAPASGPRYQMYTRAITRGVSIFWHYLDFVWLVLFGLLVFWRR